MPYCVHCGIRLGGGEKDCPLCGTPVKDPWSSEDQTTVHPFPNRLETRKKHRRRVTMRKGGWLASLLSCVLAGQAKAWIVKFFFI